MPGLTALLELAKRSMHAQQMAMNVTGNNIANAERTDYSRQTIEMTSSYPLKYPEGSFGTGVEVKSVNRIRDKFIDSELRKEYSLQGKWAYREQALSKIETVFNEPSDYGMNKMLTEFWNSWQDVSNNPESLSARTALIHKAEQMTTHFNYLNGKLREFQTNLNTDLQLKIKNINSLASQVASLNNEIATAADSTSVHNDLADQRDAFIDDLSKLIDIEYIENPNHTITVLVDGRALVEYANSDELEVNTEFVNGYPSDSIVWSSNGQLVNVENGETKGLMEIRNTTIPEYYTKLDELAVGIADQVNNAHEVGYGLNGTTNIRFFGLTTGANDITLSSDVTDDVNKIAASLTNAPGDNSNALAIYQLRNELVMEDNTTTFEEHYNIFISDIGLKGQEAIFSSENYDLIVNQVENLRQSVMGVNLDEEMVNLIKTQTAFQAASKMVSIADEMMQVVLNMV